MPGPIYSFGDYLKRRFRQKTHKVTVNAGLSCPNRDGSKGRGGCSYCNNQSFSPNARRDIPPIQAQIEAGRRVVLRRTGATQVLAYFQAYSNTYAPVDRLRSLYEEALACEHVVGLVIGTRPDCVDAPTLDLLASYRDRGYEVWLEYGLQSAHEATLLRINRGHGFADYEQAVAMTRQRGLPVCTHLILGLPGEDRGMMLETLARVRALGTDGIKLHPLHVVRHTLLAQQWRRRQVSLLTQQEYVRLACDMIERMPPDWAVHRLTGTAATDVLLAPGWCAHKWPVINAIHAELFRRGSHQGAALRREMRQENAFSSLAAASGMKLRPA